MQKNNHKIRLSKAEKKIYDSVMVSFPSTAHESAMDIAIQGGVKFQFISK
jgi:DNA-binding MurR/RpiR family transcriptional regulator